MLKIMSIFTIFLSFPLFAQTVEEEVIKSTNALRLELGGPNRGLSAFVRNSSLDSAAMYHAKWVVASGISGHIETKSVPGIKALTDVGDRASKYGATAFAENLISECIYVKVNGTVNIKETADLAFSSWKNSPGHYANMTLSMPKEIQPRIGIAIAQYSEDIFCIVMVIGANIDSQGHITE